MTKMKLSISGMHCTMCALNIDEELEDVPGVKRAKTSYAKQVAEVEYDPSLATIDALVKAVAVAGYIAIAKEG